ncbi:MAG: hypothetical protein MR717_12665 [Prevotella sp.]|nr:hypothetical protein [Prevotella sp.]MDD5894939.1 hypothetical protein [Prevotellaceae bacterium]
MIQDFFFAAWPFVACALMVAFVCVGMNNARKLREKGDDANAHRKLGAGFYTASVLMYVTSIIMLMDKGHGSSDFVVWMSLGSMFLCLGAVEFNKKTSM